MPSAARTPCSWSQEVATKQLPVPTRSSLWHEIPLRRHSCVMPGSVSGTAMHRGCPSPIIVHHRPSPIAHHPPPITHCPPCSLGTGFGCAGAQDGPHFFPHHTHPGFNCTAGKWGGGGRRGTGTSPGGHPRCGPEPVPASLLCTMSTWCAHALLPFTPACAQPQHSSLGWSWGKARLGLPSVSAAGCQGGGISWTEMFPVAP